MSPAELEVLVAVRRIYAQEIDGPRLPQPEDDLEHDLLLDSLDLLSLVVGLEDAFRVKLHEEDAGEVRTVADLVRLVAARRAGGAPEPRP